MSVPTVGLDDFTTFSGVDAGDYEARIVVLLDRARRHLASLVDTSTTWDADENSAWTDAVCELAWFYWEQEKAGVMEILSIPVSQLSLGTLFWTKEKRDGRQGLPCVAAMLSLIGAVRSARVTLEGEVAYGVPS